MLSVKGGAPMKHPRLLEPAIVAALLLAYMPGLAEDVLPEATPAALILPAPDIPSTEDNPAERL